MKHARADYNRIQDPATHDATLLSDGSTAIGEDEPVFLIRAQDISSGDAVRAWATTHDRNGGDPVLSDMARVHALDMDEWPVKKLADIATGTKSG